MGNEKSVMGVVGANISANFRMGLGPMNEEVGVEIGGLLDADLAFGIGGGTTIGPSLEAGIQGGKSRWSTLDQPLLSMVRTSLRGGVAAEFHRDARVGVRLRALVGADFVHECECAVRFSRCERCQHCGGSGVDVGAWRGSG